MFPTWRKPAVFAVCVLVLGVAAAAWYVDAQTAAWVLAGGCLVAAFFRAVAPPKHVLTARSRAFDVAVLLFLGAAIALLAPWGNITVLG
ncbi:MAG: DUF3017 domain-containing protein [bacterium]|nr:DUF3017 domain-containing protein [bacterium]